MLPIITESKYTVIHLVWCAVNINHQSKYREGVTYFVLSLTCLNVRSHTFSVYTWKYTNLDIQAHWCNSFSRIFVKTKWNSDRKSLAQMVLLLRKCSQHSNPLSTFPLLLHPLSKPLTRETCTYIPMFALITTTVSHVELLPQLQYIVDYMHFAFLYSLLLLPLVVLCFSFV